MTRWTAGLALAGAALVASADERDLRARVEEAALHEASAHIAAPDRFEALGVRFGGADPLPGGTTELRAAEILGPGASGTVRVRFSVLVGGVPSGSAWATVRGTVRGPVLTATRVLSGGRPIPEDGVELTDTDLTRLAGEPIRDPSEIAGRVPLRTLAAGRPLTRDLLREPPVVRRGDTVDLLVRRGGLVVSVKGTVERDGIPGDVVQARNSTSGALLVGRVQADGSIVVLGAAERRARS
jgi:flagella basal body P-ring formation protein FlgA